jgi:hypothetical protein
MSETANIQENLTDRIKQMISRAHSLSTQLKRAEFGERNQARNLIEEIIIIGYCTMHFSHMSTGNLEEILENVLGYFKTGLYDTDSATGTSRDHNSSFIVRAWAYTPDTHNDAGKWSYIHAFDNFFDADECITMLKEIELELKKIN